MRELLKRLKKLIPERHPLRILWHHGKGVLATLWYGFPARRFRIIAVTGTDGKTTTVAMVAHILRTAGKSVGAVSTTFFRLNDRIEWNPTHKTSLPPFTFQKFLRRCRAEGLEFVVIEASSHGLVQGRLGLLRPEVAAITNTSLEHLDYHGSMEQYLRDKGLLFQMLRGRGTKVLNADDGSYELYFSVPSKRTIIYASSDQGEGTEKVQMWLTDVHATPTSSSATLHLQSDQRSEISDQLDLSVPGTFNLENALCAIACAHAVGVPLETCTEALRSYRSVPGRLEPIDEGQLFSVFVDFTVTPAAYEKTLAALRHMLGSRKRLLVLTGCCGDRMREKRPLIAQICSKLADIVVVSQDETLTEDPLKVIHEVWAGISPEKTEAYRIPDRRQAIGFLFARAQTGDIVALCGMGACETMQTQRGLIPWDERAVARELLRELQTWKAPVSKTQCHASSSSA